MKGGGCGWCFWILFTIAGGFFGVAFGGTEPGHEDAFFIGLIFLAASFVPVFMFHAGQPGQAAGPKPTHDAKGRRIVPTGRSLWKGERR